MPREPIHRILRPIDRFLHVEAASGLVLVLCTTVALVLANSPWSDTYLGFWKTNIGFTLGGFEMKHPLKHWINDALMALFFFVVGLEVKRELVLGELRDPRRAALPVAAALGGMLVPAGIYLLLTWGEPAARGWGIPMATDIAFVVGCMTVLGRRIPHILRVVLLSLAIVDDIGAILVIAIGYTSGLDLRALLLGFAGLAGILLLSRLGVRSRSVYVIMGALVWLAFHESGVHATIAGVLLGLMTPARAYLAQGFFARQIDAAHRVFEGDWETTPHRAQRLREFQRAGRETIPPLEYLEYELHPWTSFVIMPLFALANAGIVIDAGGFLAGPTVAVILGLVIGKPIGILLSSWLVVTLLLHRLPEGLSWKALAGGSLLAGIGFTMALFIAGLALEGELLAMAKVGVLAGSLVAAVLGMLLLSRLPVPTQNADSASRSASH
jgi:NhaA family Na+:H+ antiporter